MKCQNNFWPWFSEDEYKSRYARIRAEMAEKGLEALIVYGIGGYLGNEPAQPNVVYITSFAAMVQTYAVLPLEGEPTVFVTWGNHLTNAKRMTPLKDVRVGGMAQTPLRVADRLAELGVEGKKVGIVGAMRWANINLPHDHHIAITGALPRTEFEYVTEWFEDLRLVKSEEEMEYVRRGVAMTDAVYEVLVRATRPGARPCDLHNLVMQTAQGMDGKIPFGHVGRTPMSAPEMSYAHEFALTTPIEMGDVIMTEIAVGYGGYFGKIWGTYFMGDPTPEYEKMFLLGQQSYRELHAAIKPGLTGGDIAHLCVDTIAAAGYKPKSSVFGWSNYNSKPDIRAAGGEVSGADFVFEKNQCMNVIGWPTTEDEKSGIWIGDTSVITVDGIENLHQYPLDEIHVVS
ncbi:MAG: M24 family metallopeptidase [Nitrospinota bacterium]|jgi:Xaa-Pro aminopeptidase|nr:M24 family metallopeptidase [Nitrospinota bacterium]